jgi:3-hydroxyisobutyrate dehydrogenase
MKIGFIGTGAMGRHMAASLIAAGHALCVHDARREAGAPLVEAGAAWGDDAAMTAHGAQIVFTSLPGPAEVEAIASGERGLIASMARGSAWIDLTTNSPDVVRRLHGQCAARGIDFLDAPVSGGPSGAQARKLALWVGGDAAVYAKCEPVLKAIGDQPYYVGPIGAGTVAKLTHNCASFVAQTALAEAFTLGVKAGVEPVALLRAVRQGAFGRKRPFDRLLEQFLPGAYDPPAFALSLARKDLALALELGRAHGVPMQLSEIVLREFDEALGRGWGARDSRIAMTLQEERAGVSVRVPRERLAGVLD